MKVCTDSCFFGAWTALCTVVPDAGARILDIGTGTGLLSLMLAQEWPGRVDSIELDAAAVAEAKDNINHSPWRDRIQVLHCALQAYHPGYTYQRIIVNPPFFDKDLESPDPGINRARHEGSLGMPYLLSRIKTLLDQSGEAYLLLPYRRTNEVREMVKATGMFILEEVILRHAVRKPPIRVIFRIGHPEPQSGVKVSEYCIRNESNAYTAETFALFKHYYKSLEHKEYGTQSGPPA